MQRKGVDVQRQADPLLTSTLIRRAIAGEKTWTCCPLVRSNRTEPWSLGAPARLMEYMKPFASNATGAASAPFAQEEESPPASTSASSLQRPTRADLHVTASLCSLCMVEQTRVSLSIGVPASRSASRTLLSIWPVYTCCFLASRALRTLHPGLLLAPPALFQRSLPPHHSPPRTFRALLPPACPDDSATHHMTRVPCWTAAHCQLWRISPVSRAWPGERTCCPSP